jgi:hypothetical protein
LYSKYKALLHKNFTAGGSGALYMRNKATTTTRAVRQPRVKPVAIHAEPEVAVSDDPSIWVVGAAYVAGILIALIGIGMTQRPWFQADATPSSASETGSKSIRFDGGPTDQASVVENNLLSNGSFELPITRAQSRLIPTGTAKLAWDVSWTTPQNVKLGRLTAQPAVEILSGYRDWQANEGAQFARLDIADLSTRATRGQSLVTLSQTVQTEDTQYALGFWYAPQPGTSSKENQLTIRWNDQVLDTISVDGSKDTTPQWHDYTFTVKGTGGAAKLQFIAQGTENGAGNLIDNVVLTPISR